MAVPSNGLRQAQPEREWGLLGNDNRKLFLESEVSRGVAKQTQETATPFALSLSKGT